MSCSLVISEVLTARHHSSAVIPLLQTMLKTGVRVSTVGQVEMLFSFIAPLVEEVEGLELELDDEVRSLLLS